VLTLLGRSEIPVVAGAASPLSRTLETAPHVHGSSGLEGTDLPVASVTALQMDVADFMAQAIRESETPVTLVPTGPLTNIATFRRRYPDVYRQVDQIVMMGGSLGEGNITPYAEFNIWVDPEAATEVFAGDRRVTMMGLDVTHQALFTLDDADRLEALGSRPAVAFADLLRFFARFHKQKYGWNGAPIHDAVAVGHLIDADLVQTQRHSIAVSTDQLTRGQTSGVPVGGQEAGVDVGMAIDRRRFVDLLIDAVAQFP
jgi:inosine-uridine nucleoside N-ribohydrolase